MGDIGGIRATVKAIGAHVKDHEQEVSSAEEHFKLGLTELNKAEAMLGLVGALLENAHGFFIGGSAILHMTRDENLLPAQELIQEGALDQSNNTGIRNICTTLGELVTATDGLLDSYKIRAAPLKPESKADTAASRHTELAAVIVNSLLRSREGTASLATLSAGASLVAEEIARLDI